MHEMKLVSLDGKFHETENYGSLVHHHVTRAEDTARPGAGALSVFR